jgi:murein DD-endopeptidase MepM/ murein hydrolase activator NlpD
VSIYRAPRRSFRDRAAGKLFSALAMLFAGALMIGTSVPANAFITGSPSGSTIAAESAEPQEKLPGQSVIVSADAAAPAAPRDAFTVMSYAEQLRLKYGNRSYSFKATTGAVRWPFPYAVPITDGWGERVSPCRGCSTFHQALDFTPGAGAPIYAIADGVVSHAEVTDGGLGNFVTIDHLINGVRIGSTYAHMQWGSSPLTVGSVVKVGDFVGLVGETGSAVGAHLHFELTVEGTKVDPFAWLTANALD